MFVERFGCFGGRIGKHDTSGLKFKVLYPGLARTLFSLESK